MIKKVKINKTNRTISIPKGIVDALDLLEKEEPYVYISWEAGNNFFKAYFEEIENKKLGEGAIELLHCNDGINHFVAVKLINPKFINKIATVLKEPIISFGGDFETTGGILIYGLGFLYNNMDDAKSAAAEIIEIYEKL